MSAVSGQSCGFLPGESWIRKWSNSPRAWAAHCRRKLSVLHYSVGAPVVFAPTAVGSILLGGGFRLLPQHSCLPVTLASTGTPPAWTQSLLVFRQARIVTNTEKAWASLETFPMLIPICYTLSATYCVWQTGTLQPRNFSRCPRDSPASWCGTGKAVGDFNARFQYLHKKTRVR